MSQTPETPETPAAPAAPGAAAGAGAAADSTGGPGLLSALSDALATAVERAGASIVRVDARRRWGASGLVWSAEGLVVTADHVLERDEDLNLTLPDGQTVRATIAGRDPGTDLAVLRADLRGLSPIQRGAAPKVGQLALIVGRPGGGLATSAGVVSAIGAPSRTRYGGWLEGIIRTDASVFPGFSGGALIDATGRLLGVATSYRGYDVGLAIPLETVDRVTASLTQHGRIRRGFLGIRSQSVSIPDGLRTQLGLSQDTGLLVVGVDPGSPAERGGLLLGDVLVTFNGQALGHTDDLLAQLGPERVGQATPAQVIRGGERRDLTITVGERP
ncbi:MAG TPA: S1C family serine protease [Chloroflexota bacterium]|nr:S1C family serine protease [Chloroflexota bacterium]